MASVVSIAIAARSTAAAALARTRAQIAATNTAIRQSSFVTRQHTRTVHELVGVYRDASGQWYDARGNMVAQAWATRTVTTAYGRLTNAIQATTHALIVYTGAARLARAVSNNGASMMLRFAGAFALLAVKAAAAMAVLFPLIGVVGNLLGLTQLIAPAVIAAAAGMVTLKMAFNGVSDALQAGMSGDVEELEKALKKLSPSAKSTVLTLLDLRKEWKRTQQTVQERFFAGARDDLITMSRALQPIADKWLPKISSAFGTARHALSFVIAESAKSGQLDKIFAGVTRFFEGLLNSVAPLTRALLDVAEVASSSFGDLGGSIADSANKFADWIRQMKETGKLQEWLDKAKETFNQLKEIAGNLGETLAAIFKTTGDEGASMLEDIAAGTQKLADWANGSDGQKMIDTLASVVQLLSQIGPAIGVVTTYMEAMGVFWSALWDGLKSIFRTFVAMVLGYYEVLLAGAAKAFGWVPGLGDKLRSAQRQFEEFKNSVNNSLDNIQDEVVNITYRAIRVGQHTYSGAMAGGSYSSGIGGVAAGGPGGGVRQVNEWGQEFVDFTRGMVYNSNQTKRMQAAMAEGGGGGRSSGPVVLRTDTTPGTMGAAVAALLNMAMRGGQLTLRVDGSGRVTGVA